MIYLLYAILALIAAQAVVLLLAALKPNVFKVERSIAINAPADRIFPLINDLKQWERWSPWAEKDPAMRLKTSDRTDGVGAWQEWDGDRRVGTGRMEIVEAEASSRVVYSLTFIKPFQATNRAVFALEGDGPTTVRWTMTGPAPLMSRVMDVIMNMDKLIGKDFEQGLGALKRIAESD